MSTQILLHRFSTSKGLQRVIIELYLHMCLCSTCKRLCCFQLYGQSKELLLAAMDLVSKGPRGARSTVSPKALQQLEPKLKEQLLSVELLSSLEGAEPEGCGF